MNLSGVDNDATSAQFHILGSLGQQDILHPEERIGAGIVAFDGISRHAAGFSGGASGLWLFARLAEGSTMHAHLSTAIGQSVAERKWDDSAGAILSV